jgi:hypothetical protein
MRLVRIVLCAFAVVAVSGCGGGEATTSQQPTSTTSTTSTTSASSAGGQTYSSKAFALPLTLTVDAFLKSPPNSDSRNFLSWDAVSSDGNAVRFFVPVELYRPGSSAPEAPPKDYLTYLQGFKAAGAEMSNVVETSVDGHPATLMNLTWDIDAGHPEGFFNGALGCPTVGDDQAEGCFGPQPDLMLRLGVIDVGGTTLLAWARMNRDNPDPSFAAMFERMLTTVRFR